MIDSILDRLGFQVKADAPSRPPQFRADSPMLDTGVESWSLRRLQRQAMRCAWVYSDVNLLARKIGQARFNIVAGDELVEGHEFTKLMRRPNELMGGRFLLQYTMMWLNLAGNAYWWLAPNFRDKLVEIWPLSARDVRPKLARGGDKVLAGYHYAPTNELLPPERICHFRLANPFDLLNGLSPISALWHEITGDAAMKNWNTNFFDKKNAIPTAIISLPQDTSPSDFDDIRSRLQADFGGSQRRAMVTRAGDIDVKVIGLSQKDMDFLAGIEANRETIDRVYGIPAGYWAKDASRNVSATAELIVMRDTVQPTIDYIAEEIDAQIIDRYLDPALSVVADNIVPEDRELNLSEFKAYLPVMLFNEARKRIGLPPLDDERGELAGYELRQMVGGDEVEMTLKAGGDAMRDDLLTWRKVAMREAAKGRNPSVREFISDEIPEHIKTVVASVLMGALDAEAVNDVFEPWLEGRAYGWIGYP